MPLPSESIRLIGENIDQIILLSYHLKKAYKFVLELKDVWV